MNWLKRMWCGLGGHKGVQIVHPQQMIGRCKSCGASVNLNPWRP